MNMYVVSAILDVNPLGYFTHPWFWSSFLAWTVAQLIKLVRSAIATGDVDFTYLLSTGGMPSAHSAMATGLAVSIGLTEGFGTPVAMLAAGWAAITIFDAATVRRAAGEQAKVLNLIVRDLKALTFKPDRLKELLGHSRKEVTAGWVLGIIVAIITCHFFG